MKILRVVRRNLKRRDPTVSMEAIARRAGMSVRNAYRLMEDEAPPGNPVTVVQLLAAMDAPITTRWDVVRRYYPELYAGLGMTRPLIPPEAEGEPVSKDQLALPITSEGETTP